MFGDGTCSLNNQSSGCSEVKVSNAAASTSCFPLTSHSLSGGLGLNTAGSLHGRVNTSPTCVFLSMAASRISLWRIVVFKDGHRVPHTLVAP